MNRSARAGVVLVASGTLALIASPAGAHSGEPAPDNDAGWVPIEQLRPDYYGAFSGPACGTTVTFTTGDVAEVEARETVNEDGSVLLEIRGEQTVDVTREDTGQTIEELDVSGEGYELFQPDGTVENYLEANSILLAGFGPIDEAAFDAAGLPRLSYLTKGSVTFHFSVDLETGELLTETIDTSDARKVIDLCTWFDGNRGRGDGDGGGRHAHHNWKGHD